MSKYIFVDWAGDAGFQFKQGSSPLLVIACVFVSNYESIQSGAADLIKQRGLSKAFVFHYAKLPDQLREAFAQATIQMEFTANVAVIEKKRLARVFTRMKGLELVNYFIAENIARARREQIADAIVVMDGAWRNQRA